MSDVTVVSGEANMTARKPEAGGWALEAGYEALPDPRVLSGT
jgi:hypothetical protein